MTDDRQTILLINDGGDDLTHTHTALDGVCQTVAVNNTGEAFAYLEEGVCDIILLNAASPSTKGMAFMSKVRAIPRFSDLPFLFLTDDADDESESVCLDGGAADYIRKPCSPGVLRSRVSRVLLAEEKRNRLSKELRDTIHEVSDIRNKAHQDPLTGLWNRVYAEREINAHCKAGIRGALFMIDMDNFKSINDSYGHMAGDEVLKDLADSMRDFSTPDDITCRMGGDEFILYFNREVARRDLNKIAYDLIQDISRKMKEKGYIGSGSVSIGVALIPENGTHFNEAYNAADKALYYVKQSGKSSFRFFSERRKIVSRDNTPIDLEYFKDSLRNADSPAGSYIVDHDSFRQIYLFIRRFMKRSNLTVQLILFTARSVGGADNPRRINEALEALVRAIQKHLRRSDFSTRYSSRQVIAVLVGMNEIDSRLITGRIMQFYEESFDGDDVAIDFEIADVP